MNIHNILINKEDFCYKGMDLSRPECILATADGSVWSADSRGGVVRISPDGKQEYVGFSPDKIFDDGIDSQDLPNGLCFTEKNEILIANLGKNCLELLDLKGNRSILFDSVDGTPLGKVNFVTMDSKNRIYITISTKKSKWMQSINTETYDGYIALIENGSIRIVVDGLKFPNEIRFDENEQFLYLAETTGQCIKRFQVLASGELVNPEVYGPSYLGDAGFPDGIVFDEFGNLWGTLAIAEKIFCISEKGEFHTIFDDGDDNHRKKVQNAFEKNTLTEEMMIEKLSSVAPLLTSLAFGGKDLDILHLGSVLGKRIPYIKMPIKGKKPAWW